MKEILRFFSLGVINLLGIIFPGLMFIILFIMTVCLPVIPLLNQLFPQGKVLLGWDTLNVIFKGNGVLLIIMGFMFSYVLGYIIRLTTVDKLDSISAKKIFKQMGKDYKKNHAPRICEKKDLRHAAIIEENWPFQGGPFDKFPYLHLRSYLDKRGLTHLSKLVTWSSDPSSEDGKGYQRSKKIINNYKIEVFYKSPQLSSIIEANEAHIRLTYGTWRVSKLFFRTALATFSILFIILGLNAWTTLVALPISFSQFSLILFLEFILAILLFDSKRRIEGDFHYQRIKELVELFTCIHLARENYDKPIPNEP